MLHIDCIYKGFQHHNELLPVQASPQLSLGVCSKTLTRSSPIVEMNGWMMLGLTAFLSQLRLVYKCVASGGVHASQACRIKLLRIQKAIKWLKICLCILTEHPVRLNDLFLLLTYTNIFCLHVWIKNRRRSSSSNLTLCLLLENVPLIRQKVCWACDYAVN